MEQTGIYLHADQHERLRELSDKTRVPVAVYVREGVDLMLAKYKSVIDEKGESDG